MIARTLMTLGACMLVYFMILLAKRVDFCIIWLPAGFFFIIWGMYLRYRALHPTGFQLPLPIAAVLSGVMLAGVLIFTVTEGKIISQMYRGSKEEAEYLIVLGAQVKGTVPSRALTRRLEKAAEYLEEHPKTGAFLSGGQGDGEEISEALCMYRYLTAHGIDESRLIMEDRSTTTLENLQFCAELFEEHGVTKESRIGILTNNFHVYRALKLAGHQGYRNIFGVAARSDARLQVHYMVREFFALVKEKLKGNID